MKEKEILDLLKQYSELGIQNMMINVAQLKKDEKEKISGMIKDTKEFIQNQAKTYGIKAKELEEKYLDEKSDKATLLAQYKELLAETNEVYNDAIKDTIAKQANLENKYIQLAGELIKEKSDKKKVEKSQEYNVYNKKVKELKAEANEATKSGKFDLAQKKIEELQIITSSNPMKINENNIKSIKAEMEDIKKQIEMAERDIIKLQNDKDSFLNEAKLEKNKQLAVIKKQNIVQRTVGALFNRINGANKFKNNVIEQISMKVENIRTEKLPKAKESLKQSGLKAKENIKERSEQAKDFVIDAKDFVVDRVVQGKDFVVDKAKQGKDFAIDKAEQAKDFVGDKVQKGKDFVNAGRQTFSSIISKAKATRSNILQSIEQKLSDAVEKQRETIENKKIKLYGEEEVEEENTI